MDKRNYEIISGRMGWGAQIPGTEDGPQIVYQKLHSRFPQWGVDIKPEHKASEDLIHTYEEALKVISEYSVRLANATQESMRKHFPIIIGGDHSNAIGAWKGITHALSAMQSFGLLWVDAHLDSNTPQTSPSMAIHGMPLAVLLGYGESRLVNVYKPGPALSPEHVVLFGIHSFEEGELKLLQSLNVRIFFMEEINRRGVATCFKEALSIVDQAPRGFGVSLDLDCFDPFEAPGVGSPEFYGLHADKLIDVFPSRDNYPKFKALEIAEYNPSRDINDKCIAIIGKILDKIQ